jgi:acyl-CoA reductase-like NAD-dependent aldehyde dehydrogenase
MPEPSSRDIPAPIHRPIGRIAAGAPRRAGDRLSNARVLRANASRRRATSLFAARKRGMIDSALMVQGNDVPASDGATFERLNPMTGDVATRAAAATPGDAASAVAAAAAAFPAWSALGPRERRARLLRAADCLERRASDFVDAMAQEIGATAGWAQFNVYLGAGMLREAAAMTTQIAGEIIPSDRLGMTAMALRQPVGVVLGMAPWNAPVILGVRAIAMPLACGNTVVLKSSEICPRTHRLIGEALREADLGEGVVNVVSNAPADASRIVEALVANPAVRRVNFTGSTRVGRVVAEVCARHLKPVLLELGGKAPFVILDDADLDEAVKAAAFGAFMNQGQICMSTERIVVDEAVADSFAAKFAKKAATLVAGDPRKGNTHQGRHLEGSADSGRRSRQRHADGCDGARSCDAGDANLFGRILWARGGDRSRPGRRRGHPRRQRHRIWLVVGGVRRQCPARPRSREPDRGRHLPYQQRNGE